jgi:hypothetical protein
VNKEEIQRLIDQARQLVGGDAKDPFVQLAFGEVFRILVQSSLAPAAQRSATGNLPIKSMQISEFLAQTNIRSEFDRVTAILYYQLRNGQNSSARVEILQAYSNSRARQPANLSDVIAKCIRRGHVVESPEKKDGQKAWQITLSGEKYVEEKLITS